MRRHIKRMALYIGLLLSVAAAGVVGLIAFGTSSAPVASSTASAFKGVDFTVLPKVERYVARDGAALGYRRYGLSATTQARLPVVVLIHGASDSGPSLHVLAQALRNAGVVVYVPELRGHGISTPSGDINYVGQLDDDLVDFIAVLRRREGDARLRLVGFSAGGGLALRFASGPHASLFDRYLLLAPFLSYRGPTIRPSTKDVTGIRSFSAPYVPRLIGLGIANALGIHAFDGLPVIAFAVPPGSQTLTRTYSLRLLSNLMPEDYLKAIVALKAPTTVIIGDADEFSIADEVARAFHTKRPEVRVHILPGMHHMELVTQPAAIAAVRDWATAE